VLKNYTKTLLQGSSEIASLATVSELPPVADAVGDGLGAGVISKMGTWGGGVSSSAVVTENEGGGVG